MVGNSAALALALAEISRLAPVHRPILILGERGTGKELAADRLHYLSPRWEAPLIKVNCAAIAEPLLESELFGHEPGAFTGATRIHRGRFERADGGTLFLDELGTMSQRLQEKLLRLVEYGEFERLGGQETLQVDVRVLAATNADLRGMATRNRFREDLLDRLSFDVIHLPALYQRPEDIPDLAEHFALQMSAELGWDLFPGFSAEAMAALSAHRWPGNVRELKNAVERSLFRWGDPENPVAQVVVDPFVSPYATPAEAGAARAGAVHTAAGDTAAGDAGAADIEATDIPTEGAGTGFHARVAAVEQQLLREALASCDNNQRRAARALDLSYNQLRGLVRKYGMATRSRRHPTRDR